MVMSLDDLKQDWNGLGDMDPFFAVLSDPNKRFNRWDVEEFFLTGFKEIKSIMDYCKVLGYPAGTANALDFGCGVGRLTRALSEYFDEVIGIDIAESMVAKASNLNEDYTNCKFKVNLKDDLRIFSDNYFDMIYTNIVLQHMPTKKIIKNYLSEFIRILKKDGILVFQLPSYIPIRTRIRYDQGVRLYTILRKIGIRESFLYTDLGLTPMRMSFIPEYEVVEFLNTHGAIVLEVKSDNALGSDSNSKSKTYYVTK